MAEKNNDELINKKRTQDGEAGNFAPEVSEEDLSAVLAMLDRFGKSEESRFKIVMSDEVEKGQSKKQYHLGRCDVGSPWAKGQAFDVLDEDAKRGNNCG